MRSLPLALLCLLSFAPCVPRTADAARGTDAGFVHVRDARFVLDGKPWRYVGANLWYAAWLGSTDPAVGDRARLRRELDALAALGVTNLRILGAAEASPLAHSMRPAISERGRVVDERLLEGLDYALAEIARRHMKAVVYLNNFWEWSGGMVTYQSWVNGGQYIDMGDPAHPWPEFAQYSARFYADAAANALYRDYLRTLLGRRNGVTGAAYADDPTVMAWQLANEPRPGEGAAGEANVPAYRAWIRDTTSFIRALAPRQLVSLGSEGAMGCVDSDDCLRQAYQGTGIDYMTFHLWAGNWGWFDAHDAERSFPVAMQRAEAYMQRHVALATQLRLPLVLEEFGLDRDDASFEPGSPTRFRDRLYARIFQLQREQQGDDGPLCGSNFWAWGGEGRARHADHRWQAGDHALLGDPPHEPQGWYSVFDADRSTLELVRDAARALAGGSPPR